MALFTYDLHVHSCLSPCGDEDMTPYNIAGMALLSGIRIVALTDHNSCKNCPAFFAACNEYGVVPVAGMELTTAEEIHMVCLFPELEQAMEFDKAIQPYRMPIMNRIDIFGSQPILGECDSIIGEEPWFLPAATTLTLETACELVRITGGVAYPAHIDREANGLLAVLGTFPETPVFPVCELHNKDNMPLADGRRVVVSSDAHRLTELGVKLNHIELSCDSECDAVTLRKALFTVLDADSLRRIKELSPCGSNGNKK